MSRACALGHEVPQDRSLCPICGMGLLPNAVEKPADDRPLENVEVPALVAPMSVAPPQVSPDGKWWWDGAAWQAMPTTVPPPMTATDSSSTRSLAIDTGSEVQVAVESGNTPSHGSGQRAFRLPAFAERLPRKVLVGLAIIIVAGLATVVAKGTSGGSHTMNGTYSAYGVPLNGAANGPGVPCRADTVSAGVPVIVSDHSRKQIAVGSLSGEGVEGSDINYCVFTFTTTVPDTDIYNVQVGNNSNSIAFTRAELAANGWKPGITSSG